MLRASSYVTCTSQNGIAKTVNFIYSSSFLFKVLSNFPFERSLKHERLLIKILSRFREDIVNHFLILYIHSHRSATLYII